MKEAHWFLVAAAMLFLTSLMISTAPAEDCRIWFGDAYVRCTY